MTSVIVVGSGIAGLTAALHAVASGCGVTLVTKDVLEHANTRYAQGGIAGVMFADDSLEDHERDTLVAGAGLADPGAVRVLVEEGPARIRELIALGVAFDRSADGDFVKGLEAAHSYPRILHSGGDATGTAIEKALVARLRESGVEVIEHAFLIDLVVDRGRVSGVQLLVRDADRVTLEADAVVLATGGAGELYAHTTNPPVATGDGIAAALRAGAHVSDLEFFQFHPTVLAVGDSFLVSEAVRGEGAQLIDEHGHRFAFDAHPDGELAPRDIVARAIARQMAAQDGRPVLLDPRMLRPSEAETREFLARRFPTIDRAVHQRGLDWAREPIPVTPAAHYFMGGVTTDLWGRSSLPGLYAVGEVARTGVHGANRLASNSLLEGAVFGARAGTVVSSDAASGIWPTVGGDRVTAAGASAPVGGAAAASVTVNLPPTVGSDPGGQPFASTGSSAGAGAAADAAGGSPLTRAALQELMWADAGLMRDDHGLRHAAAVIARWRSQPRTLETEAQFEDENLLLVGEGLVAAAIARTGSVGAHFRSDDTAPTTEPIDGTPSISSVAAPTRRETHPPRRNRRSSANTFAPSEGAAC